MKLTKEIIFNEIEGKLHFSSWLPWLWKSIWFMPSEEVVLRSNTMKLRFKDTEIKIIKTNKMDRTKGMLSVEESGNNAQYEFGEINNSIWAVLKNKYSERIAFIEKAI